MLMVGAVLPLRPTRQGNDGRGAAAAAAAAGVGGGWLGDHAKGGRKEGVRVLQQWACGLFGAPLGLPLKAKAAAL